MNIQASTVHSRTAAQQLGEIADGQGGQVVLVSGDTAPFYAGLHRDGAQSLLEAVLTLLNPDRYLEVLLATGEGEHLPDLPVTLHDSCSRQRLIWFLKGDGGSSKHTTSHAENGLLENFDDPTTTNGQYNILVSSHLRPWSEQMSDLIHHVGDRLVPGGPRRLIIIDDQFLQPRSQHAEDIPAGSKRNEIEREFKNLPARCSGSATDLILLCRSAGHRESLRGENAEGPIAYEMVRNATDHELVRAEAKREAARFPKLVWRDVEALELGTMKPQQWNDGWLLTADPQDSFYNVLRSTPPIAREDPLSALDKFIGMEKVRSDLEGLRDFLVGEIEERRLGETLEPIKLHVALYGQSGTGKTEVAKAIAYIYKQLGVLPGSFVHCKGRADLVAGYLGQTELKTRKKCEEALDGVLFIDEAYLLAQGQDSDFGKLAIGELLDFMESKKDRFAVIVAGYPEPMRDFLRTNDGLSSRITWHINMPEYTDDQLVNVIVLQALRARKSVDDSAKEIIRKKIAAHRQSCAANQIKFGFARDAVNLLEKARIAQARRFRGRDRVSISDEEKSRLTIDDFRAADLTLPT